MKIKRIASFEDLEINLHTFVMQPIFQSTWYLKTFAKHFSQMDKVILLGIFKGDKFVGYGAFEEERDKIVFLGMKPVLTQEEVTDFGDIFLKDSSGGIALEAWEEILRWSDDNNKSLLQLDYVREDSETYKIFKENKINGTYAVITPQEVSPYLKLPGSWDKYLENLERKERKELKRKMRRLDTVRSYHVCSDETLAQDFEEFIRLHRLSDPQKKKFMSGRMKSFFWDLFMVKKNFWDVNLCFLEIDGSYIASIMSFDSEDQTLAYNSGYDPAYDFYSGGLLLHAFKIRESIEKKKSVYDFLRGGQRYKYDLGSAAHQLYKIVISRR